MTDLIHSASSTYWLTTLVSAVLSGGFLYGVYLLLKLRPERQSIIVKTAEGVVIMASKAMEDQRTLTEDALERLRVMDRRLRDVSEELETFKKANELLVSKLSTALEENKKLLIRIEVLEKR